MLPAVPNVDGRVAFIVPDGDEAGADVSKIGTIGAAARVVVFRRRFRQIFPLVTLYLARVVDGCSHLQLNNMAVIAETTGGDQQRCVASNFEAKREKGGSKRVTPKYPDFLCRFMSRAFTNSETWRSVMKNGE